MRTITQRLVLPMHGRKVRVEHLSEQELLDILGNPSAHRYQCVVCRTTGRASTMFNLDRRIRYLRHSIAPVCTKCKERVEERGISVQKMMDTVDRITKPVRDQRRARGRGTQPATAVGHIVRHK